MKKIVLLCTTALVPSAAFAQSTGQVESEKDAIVITATKTDKGIAGVVIQDSTKAKGLITQEFISRQNPGQTIINNINFVPGATFTQNDAYGSSGGSIRIRGFDGNRVSVTFDGVPLNDSGNYAIYTNQILDPELVEQMNVNLGATDVDSPTASAAGGTINFRSLVPAKAAGVRVDGSIGSFDFRRIFGLAQTGEIGPLRTRLWLAASSNKYDHWRGPGKIDKWQLNARLYQPIGSQGDFFSVAGHYNQNRNNNYNNPNLSDLRRLFGSAAVPSSLPAGGFIVAGAYNGDQWGIIDDIAYAKDCRRVTPVNGTAQVDSFACTSSLGVQINPSNTGNIREQSRFTLAPGLVLTADGYYQYVLADGGGQSTVMSETDVLLKQGIAGSTGIDLNGDGDTLDRVLVGRPSITNTNRYTGIVSLVWKPAPPHTVRVAYTYDRAHHRQTGEYSPTDLFSNVVDPFFGRNGTPIITAAGTKLQNRDRTSIALLNQLSGQYIGRFADDRLRVELGLRSPWFKRNLDQHCYTPLVGGGFPLCIADPLGAGYTIRPADYDPATAGSKDLWAPFKASYKYHKLLPNLGATFAVTDALSVFGSYAKGLSAPRTDNLYRQPVITVKPETTDSFDFGARWVNREFQAQATAWKIDYQNRIVTSYDPETNTSIDRNVGKVQSWGVDASVGYRPIRQLKLLALASYINAKLKDDLLLGRLTYDTANPIVLPPTLFFCGTPPATGAAPVDYCARTAGKFVVETPRWQFGGRAEVDLSLVTFGLQVKRVGDRWATDVNDVKSKGYTLVDLDARVRLGGVLKKTYFQLNVTNLFNERYFGNLSTSINAFGPANPAQPRFTPGAPRTIAGTINVEF